MEARSFGISTSRSFGIRERPGLRPLWQAAEEAARDFHESVVNLIAGVKRLRNELSLSAGVPILDRLAG